MDDEHRHAYIRQRLCVIARSEDGSELARRTGGIEAALVKTDSPRALAIVALREGRATQEPPCRDESIDIVLKILWWRAHQHLHRIRRRRRQARIAARSHDAGCRKQAVRKVDRQFLHDCGAHRCADNMRALDAARIKQPDSVRCHVAQIVRRLDQLAEQLLFDQLRQRRRDTVDFRRLADIPVIEADNEKPTLGQRRTERLVPEQHLRAKTHDQKKRRGMLVPESLITEFDPIRLGELLRGLHGGFGRQARSCRQTNESPLTRAFEDFRTSVADYAARGKALARFSRALVAPSVTRSLTYSAAPRIAARLVSLAFFA